VDRTRTRVRPAGPQGYRPQHPLIPMNPVPSPSAPQTPIARGFTLVELLVVVAVIAILAALLLPALASAKRRTQSVQCLSHLRQLGLAMRLYANDDSQGLLPPDSPAFSEFSWVRSLDPYLGRDHPVVICPSDEFGRDRLRLGRTSYVLNLYTASGDVGNAEQPYPFPGPSGEPTPTHRSSQKLDSYPRPSETFLTFEVSNTLARQMGDVRFNDDHTHPSTWDFGWAHVLADLDPHRHGRSANSLFADGHVQSVLAETLRRRIEAGDNFSRIDE